VPTTSPRRSPVLARRIKNRIRVGPEDNGQRMSLAMFARAEPTPGYVYELAKGVIEVSDIPGITHGRVVHGVNRALGAYDVSHPGVIQYIGGGADAKIEMWGSDSERHPDISVYLSPNPDGLEQPWDRWVPDIVVEVVSASSAKRDYIAKRRDYLAAGVREYWILDPIKRRGLILSRRADDWLETELGPRGKWRTRLLPGFVLDLAQLIGPARRGQ